MGEGIRRGVALAALTTALCLGGGASAQTATTAFDVEHFEPLHAQQLNILNIHGSEVVSHLGFGGSVMFHMADDALRLIQQDEQGRDVAERFVRRQSRLDVGLVFGLFDRLEIGLRMPFIVSQTGDDLEFLGLPGLRISGAVIGDMRLLAKGTVLHPSDFGGFGLALGTTLFLPTGNDNSFNSDGAARFRPHLVLDWRNDIGVHLALNVGYTLRPERQINNVVNSNEWNLGLGVEVPTGWDPLRLTASLHGSFRTEPNLDPEDLSQQDADDPFGLPAEVDLGIRLSPFEDLNIVAGGGMGLSEEISSPDWRIFLGVGWAPTRKDTDGDGIYDRDDLCPKQPEDFDGFQDTDGCPDPDNDGDGIPDVDDACPDEPEDFDGFEDTDGCPDPDNDGDGIPDVDDACPDEPETFNGFEDEDGCPDEIEEEEEEETVKVTRDKIEISQKVHFALDEATIEAQSFELLGEVARVLNDNLHITKVRIEGHTDDLGGERYNQRLSQARAEAVRDYLVEAGVGEDRLTAVGYGLTRPVETNETAAGRAANRRVEFTILERDDGALESEEAPAEQDPDAEE